MGFVPFWEKDVIERETVMFIEKDGLRTGRLAFSPKRIISITDGFGNCYDVGRGFLLDGDNVIALRLVFYGDSISNAANSSWEMQKENPELTWREQAKRNIEAQFGAEVVLHNYSRSGYGSDWGREAVEEKFTGEEAHLVLLAFGMNDGSANVSQKHFADNLREIMSKIQKTVKNSDGKGVEFILISTPLPNPASTECYRNQPLYADAAQSLVKEGVAHLNMTSVWQWLLKKKEYCEISGNNLNHPNDFSYRFYGDGIGETFRILKKQNELRLSWTEFTEAPALENLALEGLPDNVRAAYIPVDIDGETVKTFAYIGFPKSKTPAPAMVLVHGGGGKHVLATKTQKRRFKSVAGEYRAAYPFVVLAHVVVGDILICEQENFRFFRARNFVFHIAHGHG